MKFSDLPQEVLVEILSYCSGADILNFGESLQTESGWSVVGNLDRGIEPERGSDCCLFAFLSALHTYSN